MTVSTNMTMQARGIPLSQWARLSAGDAARFGLTKIQRGVIVALESDGYRFGFVHTPTEVVVVIGDTGRMGIKPCGGVAWTVAA